jgi:UDPglucose 6-dehydrogenase
LPILAVVGTGYVGLVTGVLLADFGHTVTCVDVDAEKINKLCNGQIPIYEPGLEPIVMRNLTCGRLHFTTDIRVAVEESEVIFITVGTPPKEDGRADIQYVLHAAREIAKWMNGYKVIVNKSTSPVGTARAIKQTIHQVLHERGVNFPFDVVSNPEFLREGTAIQDFMHPYRIVIGAENPHAIERMKAVYGFCYKNEVPTIEANLETAEMIKYASNAYLAMKVTYINEIANVCEKMRADIQLVAEAMGLDQRIGPSFLKAGPGYGGSCFPKDASALIRMAEDCGESLQLVEAMIKSNQLQKLRMVDKIRDGLGDLAGKNIAILGITFKPNTDDIRESPALVILPRLVELGAKLRVYDPCGRINGERAFRDIFDSIAWCGDIYEAVSDSDATVILTDWDEFRSIDFDRYESMHAGKVLFDLRNLYERQPMTEKGFLYFGVGK